MIAEDRSHVHVVLFEGSKKHSPHLVECLEVYELPLIKEVAQLNDLSDSSLLQLRKEALRIKLIKDGNELWVVIF